MRIDGLIQGQTANLANLSDILGRLNPGDVLRAQVLDMMANEILLKLFDGSTIRAAVMADLDIEKGRFATFLVKNKMEGQLFLEQLKDSQVKGDSLQEMLVKKLLAEGIEVNSKNIEIAGKLNSNFLPVKKDMFENILSLIGQFKDMDISKAVFLASNNIDANEKNIGALKQLVDAKMQVGAEIEQIMGLLDKAGEEFPAVFAAKNHNNTASNKSAEFIGAFIDSEMPESVQNLFNTLKGFDLKGKIAEFLSSSENLSQEKIGQAASEFVKRIPQTLKPSEQEALAGFVSNLASKLKEAREIKSGQELLTGKERLEGIKKDLEKAFIKVESNGLEKDLDIKEIYKNVYSRLQDIKESIGGALFAGRDEFIQRIENLQNQLRFINDINSHNTYVQIPINMFGKNATGELYILKRESKRKKINPENTTLLIALDTQNIGRIESLIAVNGKNITLNIRVENENIIEFLKENYKDLYHRMTEKGYALVDVKYRLIDRPADVLSANEVANRELDKNKGSVDIRI